MGEGSYATIATQWHLRTATVKRGVAPTWPQSWIQRENWEFETHTVLAEGVPCHVRCDYTNPKPWGAQIYGHTHWVPQDGRLSIVA